MATGFPVKAQYGAITIASALLLPVQLTNLIQTYGSTELVHPYVMSIPVIGTMMFFGLGLGLVVLVGDHPEYVSAFAPIAMVGFGAWSGVSAALSTMYGKHLTVLMTVGAGVFTIGLWLWGGHRTFPEPRRVSASVLKWARRVILLNIVSLAAFVAVYFGHLPISITLVALVAYVLTTMAFPFALFVEAYHRAAETDETWQFPVLFGCLGIASILTLGVMNAGVTIIYSLKMILPLLDDPRPRT